MVARSGGSSVEKGGVMSIEIVPYPGSGPGTCRSGMRRYILNQICHDEEIPFPFEICLDLLCEPS